MASPISWLVTIRSVEDRQGDPPVVYATIETTLTRDDQTPLLPRAGQLFWLVNDKDFKQLVWPDDA